MNITAGIYKGRKIIAPNEHITRPTLSKVRMGVFNTLFSLMEEFGGKTFLDMFGGSGIMGLEALSRGFENVTVFEKNHISAEIIKKNYKSLGLTPNLLLGDSLKLIRKINLDFDVIYIDPPYRSGIYEEVFSLLKDAKGIIIGEHSDSLQINDFELIKTKNYGGKWVSFYNRCK